MSETHVSETHDFGAGTCPAHRAVVVTTEHATFFGYTSTPLEEVLAAKIVTLVRARLCVYWSPDMRGFGGLAVSGPSASCRIGPAVDRLSLGGVTSVADATATVAAAWELPPWG